MRFFGRHRDRFRRYRQDPSSPSSSLHGRLLHASDLELPEEDDPRPTPNLIFYLSLAFFTVSAVFVALQKYLSVRDRGDGRRQLHPRRALVLKLPLPKNRNNRHEQDDITFLASEDFRLEGVELSKVREAWRGWLNEIPRSCQIVEELLRSGGRCLGWAHTEPIPFSLVEVGAEVFRNPNKDGTLTGGSYSGCATMIRAGLADFALGMDTVGDVRTAAACCGIIGFKPTHGCVLLNGIAVKSDALDSVGFFVEKSHLLTHIGDMMDLPGGRHYRSTVTILMAKDLFDYWLEDDGADAFYALGRAALKLAGDDDRVEEINLSKFLSSHATGWTAFDEGDVYEALRKVAVAIADYELKAKMTKHGQSSSQAENRQADRVRYHRALDVRCCVQEAFNQCIHEGQYIMLPTVLRSPPYRSSGSENLEQFALETQRLLALASLVGCPNLVFPMKNKKGETYSVSMLGVNRTDAYLLSLGEKLIPLTHKMTKLSTAAQSMSASDANTLRLNQAKASRWQQIGDRCCKESKFQEAIFAYTEALDLCPHSIEALISRSATHLKLSQWEEAEEDCCKILNASPNHIKAWLYRARARKEMYMYLDAQTDLEMVLALDPDDPEVSSELQDLERIVSQL